MRATWRICLLLVLTGSAARCGEPASPVSPSVISPASLAGSPPVSPPVVAAAGIGGFVYDSAFRILAGAVVEVLDGPSAGSSTRTDTSGHFSMSGEFDDATRFRANAEGHAAEIQRRSNYCATCNPHHFVYFTLATLVPPLNIGGSYRLTFIADTSCAQLPPEVRTRSYEAAITPITNSRYPPNTHFELSITSRELSANYDTVPLHVAHDYFSFDLGDFHGQPGFVDNVGVAEYLAFSGTAPFTVGSDTFTSMSAPFDGLIEFCALPEPMGSRYSCSSATFRAQCQSPRHRLILERR